MMQNGRATDATPSRANGSAEPTATRVAGFLGALSRGHVRLPTEVRDRAADVLLDTVGCMIAGSGTRQARSMTAAIAAGNTGGGPATVIGTAVRASTAEAASVNAYTADVLDFEDTLVSHPSAGTVPSALATGELLGRSGAEVLTAIVAGYEVGTRVGRALLPSPELGRETAAEFWWKSIAAAVTSGMLLGLSGDEWFHCLGLAAASTPAARRGGFERRPLAWSKTNYAGQSHAGVVAANLAKAGFRANRAYLDEPRTVGQLLGSDRWRPELFEDLGAEWEILRTTFKPYPCCLYLHPLVDAVRECLAEAHGRGVAEVTAIVPAILATEFADRRPAGLVDAEFSAPYVVAIAVTQRPAGPEWWDERALDDPRMLEIMARVRLVEEPAYTRRFVEERRVSSGARVVWDDGTVSESHVTAARGSREHPLTRPELRSKFSVNAGAVLDDGRVQTLTRMLGAPEQIADIASLTAATVPA